MKFILMIFCMFSAFSEEIIYYRCVDPIENNKKNNYFELGIKDKNFSKVKYIIDRESLDFSFMYFNEQEGIYLYLGEKSETEDFQVEFYQKENKMFSYPSYQTEFQYDCLEIKSWELRYLRRIY